MVYAPIIGVNSPEQFEERFKALDFKLTDEEIYYE
jgi:aryl-alcohol dehydrogenase-like predicted oxidoreductase